MLHISAHFAVPALVALAFYRPAWREASLILIATMVVDLDHLLATPVYDPARCSIGFHPLHSLPAIGVYIGLLLVPLLRQRWSGADSLATPDRRVHLIGLGLLIHMALDWAACL